MFFHIIVSGQLSDQEERKAFIQSEIATLDGQIKQIDELQTRKDELLARMKVIQDLQGRRPVIVRVFDEMARTVPDAGRHLSIYYSPPSLIAYCQFVVCLAQI